MCQMAKKRSRSKKGSDKAISRKAKPAKKKPLKHVKKPSAAPHAAHRHAARRHEETFIEKAEEKIKEEEKFILTPHVGKYKIPVGIKVLIIYLSFIGILYLASFFSSLAFPTTIIFGQIITGTLAILINLAVIVSLGFVLYGLIKRKAYTFDLAMLWFGLGLLNAILSFFLLESSRFAIFGDLMFISFLSLIIINTLVIWYLLSEKKYFYAREYHDRPWHHKEDRKSVV